MIAPPGSSAGPATAEGPATAPATWVAEPAPRPKYKGTGAFAAAGTLFAFSLGETIAAHALFSKGCVHPIADAGLTDENSSDLLQACGAKGFPAIGLRALSDVNLLLTIAMVSVGASIRARRDAHVDVYDRKVERDVMRLRVGGTVMMATGLLTWVTIAAASWGGQAGCESAGCIDGLRVTNHVFRLTSGALGAAGAGMFFYGLIYPRRHLDYRREAGPRKTPEPGPVLVPTLGTRTLGLSMMGRF